MLIATLINWDNENRRAGNAFIRIHDAYSNSADVTVTVAKGQNARAALESSGWTVTSGVRKNHSGLITVTVERQRPLPGLVAAQARLADLIAPLAL